MNATIIFLILLGLMLTGMPISISLGLTVLSFLAAGTQRIKLGTAVVVVGAATEDGKVRIAAGVTKDAMDRVRAGLAAVPAAPTGTDALDAARPAVVFVHGAQHDHSVWILQSRYLAHHGYSVLALAGALIRLLPGGAGSAPAAWP